MKVMIIIDCPNCCTLKEIEVEQSGTYHECCSCGEYFGDGGTVKIEFK